MRWPRRAADPAARPSPRRGPRPGRPGTRRRRRARRRALRPSSRTRPPRAAARAARAAPRPPTAPRPHAASGPPWPTPARPRSGGGPRAPRRRAPTGGGRRAGTRPPPSPSSTAASSTVSAGAVTANPRCTWRSCAASSRRTTSAPGAAAQPPSRGRRRPRRPAAARPPCRTTRRPPGRRGARPRPAQSSAARTRTSSLRPSARVRESADPVGEVDARVQRLPPAGLHPAVDRVAAEPAASAWARLITPACSSEEVVESHAALDEDDASRGSTSRRGVRRCERPVEVHRRSAARSASTARSASIQSTVSSCATPSHRRAACSRAGARASRARAARRAPAARPRRSAGRCRACPSGATWAPSSSRHSRTTAAASDSPASTRPPGQLPPAGHRGRPGALGGQHLTVADDRGGDDHRLGGQRRDPRRQLLGAGDEQAAHARAEQERIDGPAARARPSAPRRAPR